MPGRAQDGDRLGSTFGEIYTLAVLQPIRSVNRQLLQFLMRPNEDAYFSVLSEVLAPAHEIIPHLITACPFTLFDMRFRDVRAWQTEVQALSSGSALPAGRSDFLSLVHSATVLAWYAARQWPTEAALFIGATDEVVTTLQSIELSQLQSVAIQRANWLRPRWVDRVAVWSELVSLARDPKAVSDGRLRIRALEHFLGELIA
jgi:hypothetical protein